MEAVKEKLTPAMISSSNERKNKPRPASLDLSTSNSPTTTTTLTSYDMGSQDMGSLAIKCISPGLPSLSAKMKTTFLISKSIEAQQRQIIASRNSATEEKDSEKDAEMNGVSDKDDNSLNNTTTGQSLPDSYKSTTSTTIKPQSATGLSATIESLCIPSVTKSNKGLKRSNIPSPLNLNLNANFRKQTKPRINSAPLIYPNTQNQHQRSNSGIFTPATARRSQFKVTKPQGQHSHLVQGRTPSYTPGPIRFTNRASVNTPITPYDQFPHHQKQRLIPTTANPYQTQYLTHIRSITGGVPQTALPPSSMPQRATAGGAFSSILTQQQLAKYQQHLAYQQLQWDKFKEYHKETSKKNSVVADVFENSGTRYAPMAAQPMSAQRQFFDLEETSTKATTTMKSQKGKPPSEIPEDDNEDQEEDEDVENNAIEPDAKVGLGSVLKNHVVQSEIRLGNDLFKFDFERRDEGEGDKERFLSHCLTVWEEFSRMA